LNYDKKIFLHSYLDKGYASINELISFLKRIYCSSIGVEYMHIADPIEKVWFRERMEQDENQLKFTDNGKKGILSKLIQAEGFEKFLALKFVATKRFGLDGAESLIPALEQIIKRGGQLKVKEVKIGMSHRGRLNVSPIYFKNHIKGFLVNLQEKYILLEKKVLEMLNIIWELHLIGNLKEILFMLA